MNNPSTATVPERHVSLWPTNEQRDLLQAALCSGPDAREAFVRWQSQIDLADEFLPAVVQLLPLVHHNLVREGVNDPLLGRLKGVSRRLWYETQQLLHEARPVVQALGDAQLPLVAGDDLSLHLTHYASAALRPLSGVALCVPRPQIRAAMRVMRSLNWYPAEPVSADTLRFRHALTWRNRTGGVIQLGWKPFFEATRHEEYITSQEWLPLRWEHMHLRQPSADCLFLHGVVNGVRRRNEPMLHWIPDAMTILRQHGDTLDWPAMLHAAARLHISQRFLLGLQWLATHLAAAIPDSVLASLRAAPLTLTERLEAPAYLRDASTRASKAPSEAQRLLADLSRIADPGKPVHFLATLPHFLRYRWALGGRRQIPGAIWHAMAASNGRGVRNVREVR